MREGGNESEELMKEVRVDLGEPKRKGAEEKHNITEQVTCSGYCLRQCGRHS